MAYTYYIYYLGTGNTIVDPWFTETTALITEIDGSVTNAGPVTDFANDIILVDLLQTEETAFAGGYTSGSHAGDFRIYSRQFLDYFYLSQDPNLTVGTVVVDTPGFGAWSDIDSTSIALTCFLAGTAIRTPLGDVAVEKLAIGQLVSTHDHRELPVKWIGRQTVVPRFTDPMLTAPICIKVGALGDNMPSRDLYTSAGHGMYLDGVLAISGALVNDETIVRATPETPIITYYHIELNEHAIVFANDAPTETFVDNISRAVFDNAAEYATLYPNATPMAAMNVPVVKSARQLPAEIRTRLAERASLLGDQKVTLAA